MVIGQQISSEFFSFLKTNNSFVADISDIPDPNRLFSRLFDDALDEGFRMVSRKTRRVQPFYLDKVDRDFEGTIQSWTFLPYKPVNSNMQDVSVVVFND